MEPELPNGDVVLIKQSMNIDDDQIYAVEFNDQTYIKKYIAIKLIYEWFPSKKNMMLSSLLMKNNLASLVRYRNILHLLKNNMV